MNRRLDATAQSQPFALPAVPLRRSVVRPLATLALVVCLLLASCASEDSTATASTTTTAAPTTTTTQPSPLVGSGYFPTDEFFIGNTEIPVAEFDEIRADSDIPADYPVRFAPEMDITNPRMEHQLQLLANHVATDADGSVRVMPFAPHWTSTGSLRVLVLIDNGGNDDLGGMSIDLTVFDKSPEGLTRQTSTMNDSTSTTHHSAEQGTTTATTSSVETSGEAASDIPESTTSTEFEMPDDDATLPDGPNRTAASARFELTYPTDAPLPARSMELNVLEFSPSRVVEPGATLVRTSYDLRVTGHPA